MSRELLLQEDEIRTLHREIDLSSWVTVFEYVEEIADVDVVRSVALIPARHVVQALEKPTWDPTITETTVGFEVIQSGSHQSATYRRFQGWADFEPVVIRQTYHGLREPRIDISEEFRLFHNLYFDAPTRTYLKFDRNGDEQQVVRFIDRMIKVRFLELTQFAAARQMFLALYVDRVAYSQQPIDVVPADEREREYQGDLFRCSVFITNCDFRPQYRSFSRLLGKRLIPPLPQERSGVFPYEPKNQEYQDFIIRLDDLGRPITHSCNPEGLSNSFGANPGAPHYLTPVFFRRGVLQKYYQQPAKYSVEDGYLRCGNLWGIRIDNNHPDHVIVFLGDLGRDLTNVEQQYWKSFNESPQGSLSEVAFRRAILGEFTDPKKEDLRFKQVFETFRKDWCQRFGWDLFLPANPEDAHLLRTLRIPLSEDQAEFDSQVLALTLLMVDSLNEKAIEASLPFVPPHSRGITKLELFLEKHGYPEAMSHIKFLRDLQELRSTGVGHRKGTGYQRIAEIFKLDRMPMRAVFQKMLTQSCDLLEGLRVHFLAKQV